MLCKAGSKVWRRTAEKAKPARRQREAILRLGRSQHERSARVAFCTTCCGEFISTGAACHSDTRPSRATTEDPLTIHHDGEVPVLSPRHPLLHVRVSSDATRSSWAIVQAGAGSRVSAPKSRYHIACLMVSLIMIDYQIIFWNGHTRSKIPRQSLPAPTIQDPPAVPPGADTSGDTPGSPRCRLRPGLTRAATATRPVGLGPRVSEYSV